VQVAESTMRSLVCKGQLQCCWTAKAAVVFSFALPSHRFPVLDGDNVWLKPQGRTCLWEIPVPLQAFIPDVLTYTNHGTLRCLPSGPGCFQGDLE